MIKLKYANKGIIGVLCFVLFVSIFSISINTIEVCDGVEFEVGNEIYTFKSCLVIDDIEIDDLDINFEMNLKNGVLMGNHANDCDACNIFHYLMAFVINKHRLTVDK